MDDYGLVPSLVGFAAGWIGCSVYRYTVEGRPALHRIVSSVVGVLLLVAAAFVMIENRQYNDCFRDSLLQRSVASGSQIRSEIAMWESLIDNARPAGENPTEEDRQFGLDTIQAHLKNLRNLELVRAQSPLNC